MTCLFSDLVPGVVLQQNPSQTRPSFDQPTVTSIRWFNDGLKTLKVKSTKIAVNFKVIIYYIELLKSLFIFYKSDFNELHICVDMGSSSYVSLRYTVPISLNQSGTAPLLVQLPSWTFIHQYDATDGIIRLAQPASLRRLTSLQITDL